MEPEVIQESVSNLPQIIMGIIFIITIIGVVMGFMKKAIYFNDYNDLGISAAVFAAPFAIVLVSTQFGMNMIFALILAGVVFAGLFCFTLYKTWQANHGKVMATIIVSISKLVMSFLYILHLYSALAGKKRTERGKAWFILAIFTPLLIGLVHTKEGSFRLSRSGRPYI